MQNILQLTPQQLAALLAWISKHYDFEADPALLSKQKMIQILHRLPSGVVEDALDNFKTIESNPIRTTIVTSQALISENIDEQENQDELTDSENDGIQCNECGEIFYLDDDEIEEEVIETVCPFCETELTISNEDENNSEGADEEE
jgi:hypothetical protein